MKGKLAWVITGCLVVISMMAISCSTAPATAPTTGSTAAMTPQATAQLSSASQSASASEKPKYGGVLNLFFATDPMSFDPGKVAYFFAPTNWLTNDVLLAGDWAKGPAGTGQYTYIYGADIRYTSKTGALAQSWKIAQPGHLIFKLRPGVHFALNPNSAASKLVNGRELTADDVAYNFNRLIKGNPYVRAAAAHMVANTTVTATDKYTVDIKTPVEDVVWVFTYLVNCDNIIPPEVVEKYGDMTDWKNSVGTGPFMLTNYTSGSSITLVRNPNYWDKNPVGPGKGDQLPYLDGVKILILPDASTQQTALRTGKIDWLGGYGALVKDNYDNLMSTTPKLQSKRYFPNSTNLIYMRMDKPDQPFHDSRVRQALTMAIDYKSIVNKLMGGDGEYPGFPTPDAPDFKAIYFPLKDAPQAVQSLYSYNPTKAKQLLAEAGYPNGFKTSIIANSLGGTASDQLSLIKDAWSKIGVDLSIQLMENAAFNKTVQALAYDQMSYLTSGSYGIYTVMLNWDGGTQFNGSRINDPMVKTALHNMELAYAAGDQAKVDKTYSDFEKQGMEQAWMIPFPAQYNYTVWWPWLKNYHGEMAVGDDTGFSWAKWVWVDQDLKKSMGY